MEDGAVTEEDASGEMVFEPILEEGVFRFDCSGNERDAAFPSLCFADPKARETPIAVRGVVPQFIPAFELLHGQQIVKIKIFAWNTDSWGFGQSTTSLYQSHPWVLAVLPEGKALGVLADTTRRCEIDLREDSTIRFVAAAAYPVITFGPFESPTQVLVSLSHAIGRLLSTISLVIATAFRDRHIPCDVIWMDIDYMHGFRCFTFDKERFPDPKALVNDLHEIGIKAIWMLDPGIKFEEGYFVYDSGSKRNIWILKEDETPYVGKVYGMLMARSTCEGMRMANEEKRPFVLTRAGFIGSQRYAATWTGDNLSNWEHLHMSIPMVIQLGLSGQPLSGPDIGGFAGNATPRLFGRWMGVGAMFPFCRGHSEAGTIDQEPWSFGKEDLPVMYLQGGSIIPVGFALQHLGEAKSTDQLSLFVALDRNGEAEGVLFEDDGDGYGYTQGAYLLTYYAAKLKASIVTVMVSRTEGSWKRPNRSLHVHILLGGGAMIDVQGIDGEEVHIRMPSESEVSDFVSASEAHYREQIAKAELLLDNDYLSGQKGIELSKTPIELKSRDWLLKVVPWIGGRIISMIHLPSGTQWLHSRVEIDGYEEYSGVEYRSAGCSEEYKVIT
ncbi:putative alpha-glucosidase [Apostasia shenzhenica]|uniref:Putative alpha-glucosidase n=1 Tax=Apostasia shenzhenica TaxID=1088818 RepID=A0A2I0ABY0_9ASPA|nr:putative alpha-glucosidase [Apostasia shenzhenica]